MSASVDGFDAEYDLIVLGAGASGMTAALVAAIEGARVLVLESTSHVGGTTARSSGTLWIPAAGNRTAITYLDALVGEKADRSLRSAFLAAGPAMIAYLERHAGFVFRPYQDYPDYRQDLPGAAGGLRPLEPPEFDGRLLGNEFERVGRPITELMLFGGMMVTRREAARLLRAGRSVDGSLLGARLVLRYLVDRLRYPRGTRLVLGNALAARLFKCLLDRQVPVWCSAQTASLIVNGRVRGAVVRREGKELRVRARCGIVLAGGGFPASAPLREKYFPSPVARLTAAYHGCVGDTLRLGQEAGGVLRASGEDNALWFPSSVATRPEGTTAVYPHIVLDRAKPGLIAVGRSGSTLHGRGRVLSRIHTRHVPNRQCSRMARLRPTLPLELWPRNDPAHDVAARTISRVRLPPGGKHGQSIGERNRHRSHPPTPFAATMNSPAPEQIPISARAATRTIAATAIRCISLIPVSAR